MIHANLKIGAFLFLICLSQIRKANAQENIPTLSIFFDRLKTIEPIKDNLQYDSVPDFDFTQFQPLKKGSGSNKYSYVIGSTNEKKIRSIIFLKNKKVFGIMSIYDFSSFRIFTFEKKEVTINTYPDFPIFCISKESRFIVYLNKRFQYNNLYHPEDIVSIHVIKEDLFPICVLSVRHKYIRMTSLVNYSSASKTIEKVRVIIAFEPEKQNGLFISDQSVFSEDIYIPIADFDNANLHPLVKNEGMPYWFFAREFDFE